MFMKLKIFPQEQFKFKYFGNPSMETEKMEV